MIRKFHLRRNMREQKGQSLVELALVLPILLLLLMGIIQFGILFNSQITLTSAAREGARLAVVGATEEQVKTRVLDNTSAMYLNVSESNIIINPSVGGDDSKLSVRVNGTVDIIMPVVGVFTGEFVQLSGESVMRVEVISQ